MPNASEKKPNCICLFDRTRSKCRWNRSTQLEISRLERSVCDSLPDGETAVDGDDHGVKVLPENTKSRRGNDHHVHYILLLTLFLSSSSTLSLILFLFPDCLCILLVLDSYWIESMKWKESLRSLLSSITWLGYQDKLIDIWVHTFIQLYL